MPDELFLLPSMTPQKLVGNSGNIFVPFPEMAVKISKPSVLRRRHEADYLPSGTRHPWHPNARVRFSVDRTESTTRSTIVVSTIFASFGRTMVLIARWLGIPFTMKDREIRVLVSCTELSLATPRKIASCADNTVIFHPSQDKRMVRVANNLNRFLAFYLSNLTIFVPQSQRQTLIV